MKRSSYLAIACVFLLGLTFGIDLSLATQTNPVPFVGCKSAGAFEQLEAPKTAEVQLPLDKAVAGRLALYQAGIGAAVLGPRGWSCFGNYGSAVAMLSVTPKPLKPDDMREGITGPVIQVAVWDGGTSGRFTVAAIVARVFPAHRSFVERIIAEGIMPASDFPFGPFPADRLTYLSDRVVEYQTPPRSQGLGTSFASLRPDGDSIRGVAIWHKGDLSVLALRLPQNLNDLTPIIMGQFEAGD